MPGHKYPIVLAFVSAGILAIGTLLKPEKPAPPAVSESETVRLERLAQRRSLEQISAYFSGVADSAGKYLLTVEPGGASALAWSERQMLTGERGAPLPRFVNLKRPEGADLAGEVVVTVAELSLAAVRPRGGTGAPPPRPADAGQLRPGHWALQVSRQRAGGLLFTPAVYGGTVETICGGEPYREIQLSVPLSEAMLGGGIFDVEGNLLGAVARCGQRFAAIDSASLRTALERAGTLEGQLRNRYGLRVVPLDEAARRYFRIESGALVAEIWDGRPGDRAGLRPGDIVVALDGEPVAGPAELDRLGLPPARTTFDLAVIRNRRKIQVVVPAVASAEAGPFPPALLGVHLADGAAGYPVASVAPGSVAARAGVRAGDRLLSAGGARLSGPAAVARLLASRQDGPRYLVFQRGPRSFGVLLRP